MNTAAVTRGLPFKGLVRGSHHRVRGSYRRVQEVDEYITPQCNPMERNVVLTLD